MILRRRKFLGAALSAAAVASFGTTWHWYGTDDFLASAALKTPLDELIPADAGDLAPEELQKMWRLYTSLVSRWQMDSVSREDFEHFMYIKTTSSPSYANEYRHALNLLGSGLTDENLSEFISHVLDVRMPSEMTVSIRLERVRRYVLGEFLALGLIRGGFRQFGMENYRGYMAGPRRYALAEAKL